MGGLLVVVHGPPGSGKSTLAAGLGRELGLAVFDRDDLKDAIFDVLGWSDRAWSARVGEASWRLLHLCVERILGAGQSMIADSNFRPGWATVDDLRCLLERTDTRVVEVYCTADPEELWRRFDRRRRDGGRHPGHVGFEERETFLADLRARPHGPLGLKGAVIELDTTGSWPAPAAVADEIRRL